MKKFEKNRIRWTEVRIQGEKRAQTVDKRGKFCRDAKLVNGKWLMVNGVDVRCLIIDAGCREYKAADSVWRVADSVGSLWLSQRQRLSGMTEATQRGVSSLVNVDGGCREYNQQRGIL